jgi:putative addiction module killer protein
MAEVRKTQAYDDWVSGLRDRTAVARIDLRIRRLSMDNPGDVKPVGEGVSEMRINHGPGDRIYHKQRGPTVVVLLCGGDKSTQSRDIAKAKELAREDAYGA